MTTNRHILLLLFALLSLSAAARSGYSPAVESLLQRLDSVIANQDQYILAKQRKIADIKANRTKARNQEELYWYNKHLYDEYYVFDADSALKYAQANLDFVLANGNRQLEYEWHINKSFTLSVMGILNNAWEELQNINVTDLSDANKIKYYGQLAYLYSHLGQLSDHRIIGNEDYDFISHAYEDSISSIITRDNPEYLWYAASSQIDRENFSKDIMLQLKEAVDTGRLNSRTDAMNSYILSRIYQRMGDKENMMKYMILSGITDVSIANRDIASLNELSDILIKDGDIERAYSYVNFSQNQALQLPNRIRAASLAETVAEVHHLHEKRMQEIRRNLSAALIVLSIILISLAIFIILYMRRSRQLKRSQLKLEEANAELTRRMEELSRSRSEREALIADLQKANDVNKEISMSLRESNYLKEECIGAAFALCSTYISRFEKYRSDIQRLARAEKWKEIKEQMVADSGANRELKDFHKSIDTLFLNIFPDFVSDFNKLLRPEEQISVAPGTLNTELRIYAMVRLGINDSVKIATLLHCSPQTVYNYRLRIRNKSIIEKDHFADAVKSLGKGQINL